MKQRSKLWLVGLLILPLTSCLEKKSLPQGLTNAALTSLENYKKEDTRTTFKNGELSYTLTALGNGPTLLVKKTNFLRLTMEESERDQKAPYPGNVSHVIQCDPTVKVRAETFTNGKATLSGYYHHLTARHALENCRPSEVKPRGFMGYLQCGEGGEVFEIKVSFPLATPEIDTQLKAFECAD